MATPASEAIKKLQEALKAAPELARSQLVGREREAGEILVQASQQAFHSHSKSGATEASLNAHVVQAPAGRKSVTTVGMFGAKPARWMITGTKPHIISAKNPPWALHFVWANGPNGGGEYFFKSVHHPGTKKQDWRPQAVKNAVPRIRQLGLETARAVVMNIKRAVA